MPRTSLVLAALLAIALAAALAIGWFVASDAHPRRDTAGTTPAPGPRAEDPGGQDTPLRTGARTDASREEVETAKPKGGPNLFDPATWEGPRAPQPASPDDPVLAMRLIDYAGAPYAGGHVSVTLRSTTTGEFHSGHSPDADGRIQILTPPEWRTGLARALVVTTHTSSDSVLSPRQEARIDVLFPLRPGRNDLGEVRLARAPILLGGTVVDGRGQPIAGAGVRLLSRSGGFLRHDVIRTGVDGRFELRGSARDVEEVELIADAHGFAQLAPIPVTLGDPSVLVVLYGEGVVPMRVRLDPWIPVERLNLRGRNANGGAWQLAVMKDRGHATGVMSLVVPNLPAGTCTVQVEAKGPLGAIAEVHGIPTQERAGDPDPRLDPWDLRGRIGWARLRVKNGQAAAAGAEVGFRPAGVPESPWAWSRTGKNGRVLLLGPGDAFEVLVFADGCKRWTSGHVQGDVTVELERGRRAEITLGDGARAFSGYGIQVGLLYPTVDGARKQRIQLAFDHLGVAEAWLPVVGAYEVEMFVTSETVDKVPVELGVARLDVAEGDELVAFTVMVAPAEVERALARLAGH